jgi:hypothetical protein
MLGDSTRSLVYTASCFKDNDHTEESTGDNMKRPRMIMGDESLKDEEQTKLSKERPSRSILCIISFLFGSFINFVLQGIAYAACHTLVKMFGNDPPNPPAPGSLLLSSSSYYFALASQLDYDVIVVLLFAILYPLIAKSGSLYMRNKFDKEDAPASNPSFRSSIWTERMFLIFGLYFTVGALVGSVSLRTIVVFLSTGMVLPWPPVLNTMIMIVWVLFLITVECFEWRDRRNWDETAEQELEDDDSCSLA